MKLMDNNGRLFGKISIIDVIVVLVVAVLAVALNYKHQLPQTSNTVEDSPITFQLWVRNQRPEMEQVLRLEDDVFDPERATGGSLGKIKDIQVSPGTAQGEMVDGSVIQAPCEGRLDFLITVEGSGLTNDDRFILNRVYELGVNSSRNFTTKYAYFTGTVVEIH